MSYDKDNEDYISENFDEAGRSLEGDDDAGVDLTDNEDGGGNGNDSDTCSEDKDDQYTVWRYSGD
jgi:hypothetical protein